MCNVHPMNIVQQLYSSLTRPCFICKIEANLCFSIFDKNSKIQNSRHFWAEENFLKIDKSTVLRYPGVENFDEVTLYCTVKEIEANLCFSIFGRNSKFKMAAIFGERKIFFEICQEYISYIPGGSKILTKSLISHG